MALVLDVPSEHVPALRAALQRDRDHFLAVAAEPGQIEEDRDDAVACVSLAAGWLAEMPRLVVRDEDAGTYLAPLLEHYATAAIRAGAFADASGLLALRARLDRRQRTSPETTKAP